MQDFYLWSFYRPVLQTRVSWKWGPPRTIALPHKRYAKILQVKGVVGLSTGFCSMPRGSLDLFFRIPLATRQGPVLSVALLEPKDRKNFLFCRHGLQCLLNVNPGLINHGTLPIKQPFLRGLLIQGWHYMSTLDWEKTRWWVCPSLPCFIWPPVIKRGAASWTTSMASEFEDSETPRFTRG